MAKVFNEQLGREMEYPYAGPQEKRKFHFAGVLNMNRCLGCQTCTMVCKQTWTSGKGQEHMWWSNVETKPYGGYPFMWEQKLLGQLPPGKTIFEAAPRGKVALGYRPGEHDHDFANFAEDQPFGQFEVGKVHEADPNQDKYPGMWMFYHSRMCNHCKYPACVAACSRKAIYKREEDGLVLVDQDRCRGYGDCLEACPYKKVFFNPVVQKSQKCIGCYPRLEKGNTPLCYSSCIGKTRIVGNIEDESEDNPTWYLVKGPNRMALPLYPQFGLEPQVYYIPPRTVPPEYLARMFTHNNDVQLVREIQQRYKNAYQDPKMIGALMLCGATEKLISRYRVKGNDVIAFDAQGDEIVRVPIEEKVQIVEGDFMNDI